ISAPVELSVPVTRPLASVVAACCVSVFPTPLASNVTVAPGTGFPTASSAVTVSVDTLEPALAGIAAGSAVTRDWVLLGGPTVPLNVAVQTPVVGSVVPLGGVSVLPAPPVTVRKPLAPPIGLPAASRAVTVIVAEPPAVIDAGAASTVEVVADTGPTVPVAVNVTGLPLIPDPVAVAVRVFVPAVALNVQLPTVAIPSVPVAGFGPVTLPPLDAANVT